MLNVLRAFVVVIALALIGLAHAEDAGVLLRYGYTPGQALQYSMTTTGGGNVQITGAPGRPGGQVLSLLLDMSAGLSQKCTDVDPDGRGCIECKYGDMTITVDVANLATTQFLVTEDEATMTVNGQSRPVPEQLKDLLGLTFSLTMDPRGRIHGVEGLDKLRELLKQIGLESFNIEQLMQQSQTLLPEEPVKVGDSWEDAMEIALPALGEDACLSVNMEYTFAGLVDEGGQQCAKLDFTGDLEMPQLGPVTLPQTLPEGQTVNASIVLKDMVQQLRGAYIFDVANGRLQRADINQTVSMQVEVSGTAKDRQGNAIPFKILTQVNDLTSTSTLKLVGVSGAA